MAETVKVRTKYQVTIPEEVRRKIPLAVGSRVEVTARGDEIVIRPIVEVPRRQAWFWNEEWQHEERQATADEKAGKTRTFVNPDEAIEWLNG